MLGPSALKYPEVAALQSVTEPARQACAQLSGEDEVKRKMFLFQGHGSRSWRRVDAAPHLNGLTFLDPAIGVRLTLLNETRCDLISNEWHHTHSTVFQNVFLYLDDGLYPYDRRHPLASFGTAHVRR